MFMGHESVRSRKGIADCDGEMGYGRALKTESRQGHENIVRPLLENNTNGNLGRDNTRSAVQIGHKNVVPILLEYGAVVNDVLDQGFAVGHENGAEHIADCNGEQGERRTKAIKKTIQLLLEHTADRDRQQSG